MILVTGGTGLVGAHLLYHLVKNEDKVRAIYRTQSKIEKVKEVFSFYEVDVERLFKKIDWVHADITDVPSMLPVFKDVKEVYHCAALVSFNPKDYIEMRKVNIHGTAIVANLSIDAKVKKLCFVGSIASVGDAVNDALITEENEWDDQIDHHGYAITKYGAEMEIWRASQEGVAVVIVNPGVIIGSGFWNSGSSSIIDKIYKGFRFYTEGVTGFVGVKDVVKSMILLMNSSVKNERFILVSKNKTFRYVFYTIADAFQKKRPKIKVNKRITAIFWRVDWLITRITGKQPLLTKHSARSSHGKSYYSSEKIKEKLIGFEFQKIEKVIRETCSNYTKTT
jgi:nucleoside-diphosphate-sugar epimerase